MRDNRILNLAVKMTTHCLSGRYRILAFLVLTQGWEGWRASLADRQKVTDPVSLNNGNKYLLRLCKNMWRAHRAPQHSDFQFDETEEEQGQESSHITWSFDVVQAVQWNIPSQNVQIRWPKARQTTEWQRFYKDVDLVLETMAKGDVERRSQTVRKIVIAVAAERFDTEEKWIKQLFFKNNNTTKIQNMYKELMALKKQQTRRKNFPLEELCWMLKKMLIALRRAERHWKHRRERAWKREASLSTPSQFAKQLLGQRKSENLLCTKEQMDIW